MNQPDINITQKVQELALESLENNDPTGWFDKLYGEAKGDTNQVPWAKMKAHPCLQNWLETSDITEKKALVIGCGLGDDAEKLAQKKAKVTAFDISPTAISWCQQRFPNSSVNYLVADLLTLDTTWKESFEIIFESKTIQALPLTIRTQVIDAIANLVKPEGTLLILTRIRETGITPDGPPWPVSELELSQFQTLGFEEVSRTPYIDVNNPSIKQVFINYQRIKYR